MRLLLKLFLGLAVLVFAMFLWMGLSRAADSICTVTNEAGDNRSNSLIYHVLNFADGDCDEIHFSSGIRTIEVLSKFDVPAGKRIIGNLDSDGNPKVTIKAASSVTADYLIKLTGHNTSNRPTLANVAVEYPGKTAVYIGSSADGHILEDVTVQGSTFGLKVYADDTKLKGIVAKNNTDDGIKIYGDNNWIYQSDNKSSRIYKNSDHGIVIHDGDSNKVSRGSFYENGGDGIKHSGTGNYNFSAPEDFVVVYREGESRRFGLIGHVDPFAQTVEVFKADVDNDEGKYYKKTVALEDIYPDRSGDGRALFRTVIETSSIGLGEALVTTATGNVLTNPATGALSINNTSEFSAPIVPESARRIDADDECVSQGWFLKALQRSPSNPWAATNSAGVTYQELDPDHNCLFDTAGAGVEPEPEPEVPVCTDGCSALENQILVFECFRLCRANEACVRDNRGTIDRNANGIPDVCDDDLDADGIPDYRLDNCPGVANPRQENNDGDGRGDACDFDDDNDGLTDTEEEIAGTDPKKPDTDGDGYCDGRGEGYGSHSCIPGDNCILRYDVRQKDSDKDGIGDLCDDEPQNPCSMNDSDGDGYPDFNFDELGQRDNCPNIYNPDQDQDADGDGVGNPCDPDDDNDGMRDDIESAQAWFYNFFAGSGLDAFVNLNPLDPDSDNDGYCDGACVDSNGDGFCEGLTCRPGDNCPVTFNSLAGIAGADAPQDDADNDGIGDFCDLAALTTGGRTDTDADGVRDGDDNCPVVYNRKMAFQSDQPDKDGDLTGDACDDNSDGDSSGDVRESENILYQWWNANDPLTTDPSLARMCMFGDLDGDGIPDGDDNCPETVNPDQLDMDNDGVGDVCDDDIDGDGILNTPDNCDFVFNPNQADADHDGVGDSCDTLPDTSSAPAVPNESYYDFQGGGGNGNTGAGCSLNAAGKPGLTWLLSLIVIGFAVVLCRRHQTDHT